MAGTSQHWISAINERTVQPIDLLIQHRHFGAAVMLILAGIDTMANISRPIDQPESDPMDFKTWVATHFRLSGETNITPDEWWEARNAILHTFGVYSRAHRTGRVERVLGWMCCGAVPAVRYNAAIDSTLVLVDVLAMRNAYVEGIERFLTDTLSNDTGREPTESRLNELLRRSTIG
jgi:hypothetical protein